MANNNQEIDDILNLFKKGPARTIILIVALIIGFYIVNPFVTVGAGQRGVLLDFGAVQDKVLNEDKLR